MKAMKSMNVNRMLGSLKRKPAEDGTPGSQLDTPEANAARNVRLFCESGNSYGTGEQEISYLPAIVEAAESSPSAAKEAAHIIRKYLGKENLDKPYIQYNGIMLIGILADNPGKTFTRNIDSKFVQTIKELLRVGRDPSVKQMLIETLNRFQREKQSDEGLTLLNEMWKKEYERMIKIHGQPAPRTVNTPPFNPNVPNYMQNHQSARLPDIQELASRIEEARNTATLLTQVVRSTPPSRLEKDHLVIDLVGRCESASGSIQGYIRAQNPSPDKDTMVTLIETKKALFNAMVQHEQAVSNARNIMGVGNDEARMTAPAPLPPRTDSGFAAPPPGPPPKSFIQVPTSRKAVKAAPQIPPPGDYAPNLSDDEEARNPFADPERATSHSSTKASYLPFAEDRPSVATGQFNDNLGIEPYHPGFRETPSYMGRQDSSLDHTTMHAGAAIDEEYRRRVADTPAGGYGAQTGAEAPIYRY